MNALDNARRALRKAEDAAPDATQGYPLTLAQLAAAHATLALVEQQRIANLLALVAGAPNIYLPIVPEAEWSDERAAELGRLIREELGL